MSFRAWVSVITGVLLVAIVFFAWPEIVAAYQLLGQANGWVLSLMVPVLFISFLATGEMIFSYLRFKGQLHHLGIFQTARIAFELNFVNHALPSGGAAGFSYLGWLLRHHGVRPGRATMAQFVRFAMTFVAFVVLLIGALMILIIDQSIERTALLLSLMMMLLAVAVLVGGVYLISKRSRLMKFSSRLTKIVNRFVKLVTRGKRTDVLDRAILDRFFDEIHKDYEELLRDKKILARPFVWAVVATLAEVMLLYIAFLSLGVHINPAMLLVAFGVSTTVGMISVTPGGAGLYEAIMIALLTSAGVAADVAIAGTLLARVIVVTMSIVLGYVFYQLTIMKYGKHTNQR